MVGAKANRIVEVTVRFTPRPRDVVFKVFSGQHAVALSRRFYRAKLKANQSPRVVGAKKECEMTASTETVAVKTGYAIKFYDSPLCAPPERGLGRSGPGRSDPRGTLGTTETSGRPDDRIPEFYALP